MGAPSVELEAGGGLRRSWLPVAVVALLAFALRLVYVLHLRESPYFDAPMIDPAYHLEWARAILGGEAREPGPFFRAPLYIWFLTLCLGIGEDNVLFVRIVQCALGATTAVLTFLVGRRAFDARVGWLAGLAAASYWVLIYFDGEFLLPTLAVPLNMLALLLSLRLNEDRRVLPALSAGLVWGLASITRPNSLLFIPFLAVWLLRVSGTGWRTGLRPALALVLGTLIPILPITAYNFFMGEDTVLISSQAGVNLWIGNNPSSDGQTARVPGTSSDDFIGTSEQARALAEREAGRPLRPSEVSAHYSAKALDFMVSRPGDSLALFLRKFGLFWKDQEISNNQPVRFFAEHFSPIARWSPLGFGLLAPLGVLGLLISMRRRLFPLWGFVLVYMLSVVLFFVCARFRVPVLPPLMIFAAQATVCVWDQARRRRFGPVIVGVLLLSLASSLMYWRRGDRGEARADGLRHLAIGYALAGEPVRAEPLMVEAVELQPGDAQNRVAYGDLLEDLARPGEAREQFEQALERAPADPLVIDRYLGCLARGRDLSTLELVAEEALRSLPGLYTAQYHLGVAHMLQNRGRKALAAFEAARAIEPRGSRAQAVLGNLYKRQGRMPLALEMLEEAVRNDSFRNARRQEEDTRKQLVNLLLELGHLGRAGGHVEVWLARYPESDLAQAAAARLRAAR